MPVDLTAYTNWPSADVSLANTCCHALPANTEGTLALFPLPMFSIPTAVAIALVQLVVAMQVSCNRQVARYTPRIAAKLILQAARSLPVYHRAEAPDFP